MIKPDTFDELYAVKYREQQRNGYWRFGQMEHVVVAVKHGQNEKNNHKKAWETFKMMHPNAIVEGVVYC